MRTVRKNWEPFAVIKLIALKMEIYSLHKEDDVRNRMINKKVTINKIPFPINRGFLTELEK